MLFETGYGWSTIRRQRSTCCWAMWNAYNMPAAYIFTAKNLSGGAVPSICCRNKPQAGMVGGAPVFAFVPQLRVPSHRSTNSETRSDNHANRSGVGEVVARAGCCMRRACRSLESTRKRGCPSIKMLRRATWLMNAMPVAVSRSQGAFFGDAVRCFVCMLERSMRRGSHRWIGFGNRTKWIAGIFLPVNQVG